MRERGVGTSFSSQALNTTTLEPSLTWVRTAIVATMTVITLAWPIPERVGFQSWFYIAAFAGYDALIEVIRWRFSRSQSYRWVPFVDIVVAAVLYVLDGEPGGPLFVAFYLAVVTAAVCHPLRTSAPLIAVVIVTIIGTTAVQPGWTWLPGQIQELTTRLFILGAVGVGTAILTRRLARQHDVAEAIKRESERIDELNRLRGDFISSVSHDLKTPLTSIVASLGMLRSSANERLHEEERALLANARRNVDRLGAFIEDLISASQLTSGTVVLEREPLDVRDVIADAMATLYPLMSAKQQILEADLADVLPVDGDRKRLSQILVNLLSNAHLHTPPGTRVEIAGHRQSDEIVITISDNGPGIPSFAHAEIFQPFYRLSTDTLGSGLGLANARRFAELHGGQLTADRSTTQGAVFQLTLPVSSSSGVT